MKRVISLILVFMLLFTTNMECVFADEAILDSTSDEETVQADYDWLIGEEVIHYGCYADDIRSDVVLPINGENGSSIAWISSDERWIAIDGTVTQPPFSFAAGNALVTLTATISSGTASQQKTFELEVVSLEPTDGDKVAIDKEWLTYDIILNNNIASNVKSKLNLPVETPLIWSSAGYYGGSDIAWESSNPDVIAVDGSVIRPGSDETSQEVTLTATISNGEAQDTKTFDLVVNAVEEFSLAINYDDFSNTSRLRLNGISGIADTTNRDGNSITAICFDNDRLANITTGGSIFTKNKIRLGEDLSFSASFSYSNPHPDYTKGDGGFVFTLQTIGDSVYSQSYNDESIKPSLNIAFVTDYYSAASSGQATNYYYSESAVVYYNGDYEHGTTKFLTSGSTNDTSTNNTVWIEYDGESKLLEVRFSQDGLRPAKSNLTLENVELDRILTGAGDELEIEDVREVYVGFMGSMGDAKDESQIKSLYFKNDSTPIDFEPYNFIDVSNVDISASPPAGQASSTISALICNQEGIPAVGIPVSFSTSFGVLDSSYAVTNDLGYATMLLHSGTSGTAIVKAFVTGGAMDLTEVQLSVNDEDKLTFDSQWLTDERILGENSALNNIAYDLSLPLNAPNGSVISWESSNLSTVNTDGVVARPSIIQGNQDVTLTATISRGDVFLQKSFEVTVKVCDEDLVAADKEWLTDEIILNENESMDKITSSLNLPTTGENGSAISWTSNKEAIVSKSGTVNPTSFAQGNQSVVLTATINMGAVTLEKTFNFTVMALEATDAEVAYADFVWLTKEIVANENESLEMVLTNLNLPVVGFNGSEISWESTNEAFASVDGTINRPTYTQGTQYAILTATIGKGSSEYTNSFYITVYALATDAEALLLDKNWLNYAIILGENKIYQVTVNLNLPVVGMYGSSIRWISNDEKVIATDGTVIRPTYTQGNKTVKLTAFISKGGETVEKSFSVLVEKLGQTDQERVIADKIWLNASRTLGENLSQYSINQNLSLPTEAANGSFITWNSNMPSVISINGEVTIPEYKEGHKNVVLTATFEKGSVVDNKTYNYTVLSKPDTFSPVVVQTTPINNGSNILWNTSEITITFDEEIKVTTSAGNIENYGITINGLEAPSISVSILKNKLTINLIDYLKSQTEYEVVVPSNTIKDMSDNYLNEEILISFGVEEKLENKIEVLTSLPNNMEKEVSCELDQISFEYNYSDITKGNTFENISLLDISGNKVGVTKSITKGTVILTIDSGINLQAGSVYEVSIPADAVVDRFENSSLKKSIKFRTKSSDTIPSVSSYYPHDGETGVDVHQRIQINFSEAIHSKDLNLVLLDDEGNIVKTQITLLSGSQNSVVIESPYYKTLKANTVYTVKGPYNNLENNLDAGFEISFTTGSNTPSIEDFFMLFGGDLAINTPIEISFSESIFQGAEFNNIKVLDLENNELNVTKSIVHNKLVIVFDTPLNTSETYAFYIPKGALKNQENIDNDAIKFWRTTAARLNYGDYSFYTKSTWVTEKVLTFNARWLGEISRDLKSVTWDFGDGDSRSGLSSSNVYWHPGDYKVTLTLVDDKDISYEWEKTITISELDLSDLKMSVYHEHQYLCVYEENNQYGLKNLEPFSITLYSPSIGYVSYEKVKVSLYKNGALVENLGNIETNFNGEAEFSLLYGNKGYFGNYDVVFEYDGTTNKKVYAPVTFVEATLKQAMVIMLINEETGEPTENNQDMYFELNGKQVLGQYENLDYRSGCYVIKGLETGATYSLALQSSQDSSYISDEIPIYHEGSDFPVFLTVKVKSPGLNYIRSALTDSSPGNRFRGLFIQNISIPNLKFELVGDWDGLEPGYYELKSSMGSVSIKSDNSVIELQPGLQMQAGEELWGRMVSKSGVATLWQNTNVKVAPYPSLGIGPTLNISYINGQYIADVPFTISGLTGGKIDILDGVPLLDNDESFGLGSSTNRFEGNINERGSLNIAYEYSAGQSMDIKESKALSTGYDVEAGVAFHGLLYYDMYGSKEWKLNYYNYYLTGRGSYYWEKPYTIPKINIGGWGNITLGSNIGGVLSIKGNEEDSLDFEGIIGFNPYVSVSIGAGIKSTVSVEGSVLGSVPAEFHIPTGYIQAEPNISAFINVYYIYDSSQIYYKEIASTHWDNGKEKVKLFSMMSMAEIEEDIEFTPTARNYLERGSTWLVGNSTSQKSMLSSSETKTIYELDSNPQIETMTENIYPMADVQLIGSGNENWMVWTDDNPIRDANNRTQLKYSVLRDGSWIEPEWFGQDETADFSPTAAMVGDGMLVAWQNIKNVMTEETKSVSFVQDAEISVTKSIYNANGNDPDIIMLTDDDKFDHAPVIVADNEKAILVWTKSDGLGLTFGEDMDELHSSANSDCLFSSVWNGTNWSTPEEIENSMPTVIDSSLTMNGEETMLLYTLDMDNDQSTQDDREIYYRIHDGMTWSNATRLTNNNEEDLSPKAVNISGEWFIIWLQNGSVVYKAGLGEATKTNEFLSKVPNNYQIAVMEGDNPQLALVYTNSNTSLYSSFYDIKKGIWSDMITLSEDTGYIRSFSPIFTEEGTLNVVYTQAEVIKKVVQETEFLSPSDKVDLMMLSYTPIHDLAFDEDNGLQLTPTIPKQGTMATVSAVVNNLGDFAENATIYLYEGNSSDGKLLGEITTSEPIAAHSTVQLDIEWIVGMEDKSEYDFYAIVQPDEGIKEASESNNTLNLIVKTADLAVKDVECENISQNNYLTKATIKNSGGIMLEDVTVEIVHEASGQILEKNTIGKIMSGQQIDLNFLFSSSDLTKDDDGEINMFVRISPTHSEEEYSTENNTFTFTLEQSNITVDRIEPAPNETHINIEKPIIVHFNMNVEPGIEFGEIKLIDDDLNEIDINKTLNGSILTIAPQNVLSYGTGYTLTLPDEAVSDSYGHIMNESYSLSFVTTLSSPEIIFAYPGDDMTDIALDTEIKVQLNQDVLEGPTFNNIAMNTPNYNNVLLSASIEGEWMYLSYAGHLSGSTTYSITIPAGALQNANSEVLNEDYVLSFTTKQSSSSGNSNKNTSSTDMDQQQYNISRDERGAVTIKITEQAILNAPFKISVPYTPTAEELLDPESIIISYLDENGNMIVIPDGYYDPDTGSLIFSVTYFSSYVVSFNKVNFNDVDENAWYKKAVSFIGARGITQGTGNGNYSPESKLTRSDFLVLLMKSYGITPSANYTDNFQDVGNTYYTNYIAAAKKLGITEGVGNNMFAPEREITRQEMFTLLYNALKIIDKVPEIISGTTLSDFTDAEQVASWAKEALTLLVETETIKGNDGKLSPTGTTTRAEMAQVLYNLLSR